MPLFKQEKQSLPTNLLKNKYGWAPFSVLNTTTADWQRRSNEWKRIIGDSSEGREGKGVKRYNATPANLYSGRPGATRTMPVSVFDPQLCEIMYRWFSLPGAKILDPFAGGSVRGLVASILQRHYVGIDLSPEQVSTNYKHLTALTSKYDVQGTVEWICDDSDNALSQMDNTYDFIFTCPPYYKLEQYTKDPRDLSRLPSYADFLHKYTSILTKAVNLLKEDSFLVIVVSEVRADSRGLENSGYIGLVPDTIHILKDICSLHYYNEIILINNIGSLPMRAPQHFESSRKVGRQHQNVLVFYKGNIANISDKFGKNNF